MVKRNGPGIFERLKRWWKPPASWAERHRTFIRIALTFMVTLAVGMLDILSIHSHLESLSETVAERALASFYRDNKKPDQISVLLIDDIYMKGSEAKILHWPLPTNEFLSKILHPLVELSPKAIFIDISFTDMPRSISSSNPEKLDHNLQKLAEGIKEESKKLPIFLSDQFPVAPALDCSEGWVNKDRLLEGSTTSATFIQALKDQPNIEIVPMGWLGPPSEYPFAAAVASRQGSCGMVRRAQLEAFHSGPHKKIGGFLLSPAAAVLRTLCPSGGAFRLCADIKKIVAPHENHGIGYYALSEDVSSRMVVRWGTTISPLMREEYLRMREADKCKPQTRAALGESALQAFYAFVPAVSELATPPLYQRPCFYIDWLSAARLDRWNYINPNGEEAARLKEIISGRVVMIGADLPIVKDSVMTPLGLEMPGVFLHAMALDNMLKFDDAYPRRPEGTIRFLEQIAEALIVALLGYGVSRLVAASRRSARFTKIERTIWKDALLFMSLLMVASALIFSASLMLSLLLGWAGHFPYFGSPVFIALASIVVLTEDLRHMCFETDDE